MSKDSMVLLGAAGGPRDKGIRNPADPARPIDSATPKPSDSRVRASRSTSSSALALYRVPAAGLLVPPWGVNHVAW